MIQLEKTMSRLNRNMELAMLPEIGMSITTINPDQRSGK